MSLHNLEDIYELSPMQRGMLFHSCYSPTSGVYFEQLNSTLRGNLNVSALEETWQRLVDRHQVLRTSFNWEDLDKPVQLVHRKVSINIEQHDWRSLPTDEQQERLQKILQADKERGFDLSRPPLMRLTLVRMAEDSYQFIWSNHHMILDGWSQAIITGEVSIIYKSLCAKKDVRLKPTRPYRDYITWLQRQNYSEAEAYWRRALAGFSAPTRLWVDRGKRKLPDQEGDYSHQETRLSFEATERLREYARGQQLTLNTLVQGAWAVLLSRYTGTSDVVFGTTVSGRGAELAGIEEMVGLFINTLPVRVEVRGEARVSEWLRGLQEQQVEMRQYEYSPLVEVQRWSGVGRGEALFDTLLVFENYPNLDASDEQSSDQEAEEFSASEKTNYPLTLAAGVGKQMWLRINYESDKFDSATVISSLRHLQTLLNEIATGHSNQTLSALQLIGEDERRQLLIDWNDTRTDYPRGMCVHELFEQQAGMTPDAVAVVCEGARLTYGELNKRANRLARQLRKVGVGLDVMVGLYVERSLEMVVGLLAILKAGGAYVPLDSGYPQRRLALILEDTNLTVLLTQRKLLPTLPPLQAEVVCIDDGATNSSMPDSQDEENFSSGATPENLAYVTYTSGSTGRPKGVCIPHRGVVRLVKENHYASLTAEEVFLQFAPLSFDASTFEIWGCLLNGARLVVFPPFLPSLEELAKVLEQYQVTTLWLTAGLFHQMAENHVDALRGLRQLLAGGDVLSVSTVELVLSELKGCRFINGYGPTENTTFTCCYTVNGTSQFDISVPIGRPIANTQVYLLDAYLRPAPVGVAGELYTGGAGLARGYWNEPGLTAEKFIPNPFDREAGARLYRTGDLARYRRDGQIEFLGRIDQQVKIRGYRVELGEIEAALAESPSVREAVVVAVEDKLGGKHLAAYVVGAQDEPTGVAELRNFLAERLPEFMIPSAFMMLDSLPLTPQGKIDRRALPAPDQVRSETGNPYVPPRDILELKLVQIWEETFDVRPVGVTENFFDLGGDSFKAMHVTSQIRKRIGQRLPLATLFQTPTIEELTIVLRQHDEAQTASSLISFQTRGSRRPFFCVHPFGGSVVGYAQLVRCLGEDQPVYGLQAAGLEGEKEPFSDMSALAAYHIEAMRTVQSEGPYLLGGWSFGGIVAFEIAQQLHWQGQKVGLLALFDADPIYVREVEADYISKGEDLAVFLIGLFGKVLPLSLEQLSELSPDEQMLHMIELGKKENLIPPDFGLSESHRWLKVLQAHRQAGLNYIPQPYPGCVTLFSAAEGRSPTALDPTDGWGELATGGVDVRIVPGDHRSMMSRSNAENLAAILRTCIDEAEQRQATPQVSQADARSAER